MATAADETVPPEGDPSALPDQDPGYDRLVQRSLQLAEEAARESNYDRRRQLVEAALAYWRLARFIKLRSRSREE
jgi:hypothetical protein